jgi:hypothetical protein
MNKRDKNIFLFTFENPPTTKSGVFRYVPIFLLDKLVRGKGL